ncbi:dihydrolipoyl dehydrogenase [Porphyromonadaceae sp. NP-X]|jgi:dihydrolipoamide dehydrogenase|nr:dihydrolipoyl dehydrogenase [Paludibacteraceae bacterium]MDS1031718.1 dihydrolipoyl dehydrogenase [Porphyromonadaceae sp. NP-X]
MFDLGIIGGGPAGYSAAERAAVYGLKVVIFEKSEWGGVCLNCGCIPTKAMLYSAKLLENIKEANKYGISVENVSYDYAKIILRKNKIVRKLNAGIRAKLNHENIQMVQGEVYINGEDNDIFSLTANGQQYECCNLLICTGSHNVFPPIKGINPETVWSSTEALDAKDLPSDIVIIGGGVIGIELAAFFNAFDVKVTIIEMLDEILGNMDRQISALLRQEFTKKGIRFFLNSKVLEKNGNEILFENEGQFHSISAGKVLLSVGRKPNISGFGLENLPVEILNGGIKINNHCQTSLDHVFAAGDVTGFSMLAHTAVMEAEIAVDYICGKIRETNYSLVPSVVYTFPEVASVGETEESLHTKNQKFKITTLPMSFSGRFVAENEGKNGLCKILSDENGKLLGIHLLGNPASELITTAALAIECGLSVNEWQSCIFPHPTTSEIFKETLFELIKNEKYTNL